MNVNKKIALSVLLFFGCFFSSGAFAVVIPTGSQVSGWINKTPAQTCSSYVGSGALPVFSSQYGFDCKITGNATSYYQGTLTKVGVCPAGYQLDATYSYCNIAPPVCSANQHLNADNTLCVADDPITCPVHQHNVDNYTCVADDPITCPVHQHNVDDYTCVADDPITCAVNQHNADPYTCVADDVTTAPLCLAIASNGALSIDAVTSISSCPYVLKPASGSSATALDLTALNTLFSEYFAFDLDLSEFIMTAYFVSFISGHVLGRVISGLRKV